MKRPTITVFGSGMVPENSEEYKIAYEAGFLLAKAGFIVANGGYGGTMRAVAQGAKAGSGKTVGITTQQFPTTQKNEFIDSEIRKPLWRERLFELAKLGDGFVVLDGGTGTLAELMVVWEMKNKGLHKKPIVVLGKQIQNAVEILKQNKEVKIPADFQLAPTPKAAVEFLKGHLLHV